MNLHTYKTFNSKRIFLRFNLIQFIDKHKLIEDGSNAEA